MASDEQQARVLALAGARDATPGEIRTVHLLDRRGRSSTAEPTAVTVVIPAACPVCGKARGEPEELTVWDVCSRSEHPLSVWRNACGHTDLHADVLEEAERAQLNCSA